MNKILKAINVLFVVLLLLGTSAVKSATSTEYSLNQIDVDGTTVFDADDSTENSVVFVERGTTSVIEVWITGENSISVNDNEVDDVKVKAWIGGHEFGDIEDTSSIFTVQEGITYKKVLRLDIPSDFNVNENDDTTLNVEVFDSDNNRRESFPVRIQEQRHSLNIIDVILNPGLSIDAGKVLFGTVRAENLGEKTERDIKVVMSIPELGLSTRTFIDELVNEVDAENEDEDDRVSASSDELFLKIPENTKEGTYTLKVQVIYNRGHTTEERTYALNVNGITPVTTQETVVSIDSTSQSVEAGKGAVFKLTVTNMGSKAATFTADAAGVSSWGSSRVDPSSITVLPDQTGEMFVFVSANENADSGEKAVTLTVKSGDSVVKQIPVTVKVSETGSSADTFGSLRKGLEVGFIVLLIVLVILGLILAARKLGSKEDEEEGKKTYY